MNMLKYLIIIMEHQKNSVNKLHQENYDVVFDIDWQGTKQLTKYKELNLIKIFILTTR